MSKVLSAPDLACDPWQIPEMDPGRMHNLGVVSARHLEEIQRQAYEEGLALGRKEALAANGAQLQAVLAALFTPLRETEEQVTEQLAELIRECAKQLLQRELITGTNPIMEVVREALRLLPAAGRKVRISVNPADGALLRELAAGDPDGSRRWQIVDDPALTRGGCRVSSEAATVNGTVESRLQGILSRMQGEAG